jgi:K319-like protein
VTAGWTRVYGPGTVTFTPPNALSTTATFPGPGVYVLRVTVSDSLLTASDDVQVTVEATRPALFVVASESPMTADDARIKQELEAAGFTPVLKNHLNVAHTDADDKDVVLISSSIPSGAVGGMFLTKAKPVVLWENQLYDEMGMTAANGGTAPGTEVSIVNPAHPMAAHLAGTQTVQAGGTPVLDWGTPGPNAIKVATLTTDASKATLFGYEQGSTMASGLAAPARRVGVFASSASLFTNAGAALFRAAVNWAAERPAVALLVVASTPLSPSDQVVKERIAANGFGVTVVTGAAAVSADANGKAFVVISNAPAAAAKFLRSTTAVVVWDGSVMAAMGMVPPTPGSGYGTLAGQTKLSVVQQLHPLSAGLTGPQTVTTANDTFGWGLPASSAAKVATLETDASRATVFGYEVGALLHPHVARPAAADRRVGLFLGPATATLLTNEGGRLLDAAFRWAGDSDPDRDGLGTADEYRYGTNPLDADTNDDGLLDGAAVEAGISPTSLDVDGDGLTNDEERSRGTDPFNRDTDGDTAVAGDLGLDGVDCFPLDPTRWLCPPFDPNDHTPPVIQLREPVGAVLISSVP